MTWVHYPARATVYVALRCKALLSPSVSSLTTHSCGTVDSRWDLPVATVCSVWSVQAQTDVSLCRCSPLIGDFRVDISHSSLSASIMTHFDWFWWNWWVDFMNNLKLRLITQSLNFAWIVLNIYQHHPDTFFFFCSLGGLIMFQGTVFRKLYCRKHTSVEPQLKGLCTHITQIYC